MAGAIRVYSQRFWDPYLRSISSCRHKVTARTNPVGPGSEFRVTLPLFTASKTIEAPAYASSISSTPNAALRVLVVDDNKDSAESLSLLLQLLGNNVNSAYDGEQALEMAKELKPDVVLLDIGLPKLNGYDVAKQIRLEPWGTSPITNCHYGLGSGRRQSPVPRSGFRSSPCEACRSGRLVKVHSET